MENHHFNLYRVALLTFLLGIGLGQVFIQQALAENESTSRVTQSAGEALEIVYELSPFDTINLSVYGQDDLEISQRISDKGTISVPLLGALSVGGLTITEASDLIEKEFVRRELLREPIVSLSIEEFSPKVVTILGEVESPGSVEIPPGRNKLPLQVAIAGAGGMTGTAKSTSIRVSSLSDKGKKIQREVDLDRLLKAGDEGLDYVVPNDIIFVPRRVF